MNSLLHGLKRLSAGIHNAIGGGRTRRLRSSATTRTAPRARLAVEELETRAVPTASSLSLVASPVSSTQVYLSWTWIPDSTYEVDEVDNGVATELDYTSNTVFTVNNLDPYTTYSFQVFGGGVQSSIQSVTTLPANPSLTATAASWAQVNLSWSYGLFDYYVDEEVNGVVTQAFNVGTSNIYSVTGLSPSTTYAFSVSFPYGGYEFNSNVATVTTPSTAPSLTATPVSATQVNLAWNSVFEASDYLVYEQVNNGPATCIGSSTGTSFPVSGLSPYTTYNFQVGDIGPWGISWASRSATTLPAPLSLAAAPASSSQMNLSWNSVAGATDYVVYESGTPIANVPSGTTWQVAGLNANTNYSFQVCDIGPWGLTWSNSQSATTLTAAPSVTATAVSPTQISLSWNSVPGAYIYFVEEMVNGAWHETSTYSTSFSFTNLSPNTVYQFEVGAFNLLETGTSWSTVQSIATLPLAPVLAFGGSSSTGITLTWNSVSCSGYLVDVDAQINGYLQPVASVAGNATSYTVYGLSPNTTYEFQLGAYNGTGASASWSNIISAMTTPAAPTLTATALSSTQINLSWNNVAGSSGYLIDESANGSLQQIILVENGVTGWSFTSLSPNTTYTFQVASYNAYGSAWSNAQSALTFPTAPSVTATPVSATQINLAWNSVAGANGYYIFELINGSWQQIAGVPSSDTSAAITGLSPYTTYTFEIGAYNASGTSWGYVNAVTLPAAPTFTLQAISMVQVNVAWNSVPGATGYMIDEMVNGSWQTIATLSASTTSFSVTGLSASTTYEFKVAAFDASGTTWADPETVTTLPPSRKLVPG